MQGKAVPALLRLRRGLQGAPVLQQLHPQRLRITTRSASLPAAARLFRKAFGVAFDQKPEDLNTRRQAHLCHQSPEAMAKILETYGYARENSISHHINYAVLEEECCRSAFCGGPFLAGGSVTDPEKRYHLELATSHPYVHQELSPC